MMSGKCLDCGAEWDAKCIYCRNVFWNETNEVQFQCPHRQNVILRQHPKCDYSGCDLTRKHQQFSGATKVA
jgi:hypothetical protein